MKTQNLTQICEATLTKLIHHIKTETAYKFPPFNESLKEYNNLKSKMGLAIIAAVLKQETNELIRFEIILKDVNGYLLKKEYENRNCIIAQLKFLVFMEQINAKIPSMSFLSDIKFPLPQEKDDIGLKKIRAIELVIRALINERYHVQEKLVNRLRSIFDDSTVVEKFKKSTSDHDILSGATFSQLIMLFVHEEEFKLYQKYFEGSPYLTYLNNRRASLRHFLHEIRKIRNLFAHGKMVSDTRLFMLDMYCDELLIPLQKSFGLGKTKVNPEEYLNVTKEGLEDYLTNLRRNILSVSDDVREDMCLAKPDRDLPAKDHTFKDILKDIDHQIGELKGKKLSETEDRRNKLVLAKRVYKNWIHRIIPLDQGNWLEIEKEQKDSLIERPFDGPSRDMPLPPNTHITDIFGDAIAAMLIVGDAGVGKTSVTLELARYLLIRAINDPSQPMPVILNLSSWTKRSRTDGWQIKTPLFNRSAPCRPKLAAENWLINQLVFQYGMSKDACTNWIMEDSGNHLLYILDGLDEVAPEHRVSFLTEIQKFRNEHRSSLMIVTTRLEEYLSIGAKLKADMAILLKPLTIGQIENNLPEGMSLDDLKDVVSIDSDREIEKLMTPLVLHILRLVPVEKIKALKFGSVREFHHHLFRVYTNHMFEREAVTKRDLYNKEETIDMLSWLAHQMKSNSQSVFYLEKLQPTWLSGQYPFLLYIIFSRVAVGLTLGSIFCVADIVSTPGDLLAKTKFFLGIWISIGVTIGLIYSASVYLRFIRTGRFYQPPGKNSKRALSGCFLDALTIVSGGLITAWFFPWGHSGFSIGVLIVMIGQIIFGFRVRDNEDAKDDIHPVERLTWDRITAARAFKRCLVGFPIALLSAELLFELLFDISFAMLLNRTFDFDGEKWQGLLFYWLAGSTFSGILGGFFGGKSATENSVYPNQTIRASLKNAVVIYGASMSLILLLCMIMDFRFEIAIVGPIPFAFIFGGATFIQHFALRLILSLQGNAPWRYVEFLDYARERILLEKKGGGYSFYHNLLRDYFASLRPASRKKF